MIIISICVAWQIIFCSRYYLRIVKGTNVYTLINLFSQLQSYYLNDMFCFKLASSKTL